MECNKCKYFNERNDGIVFGSCSITNICNTTSCSVPSDEVIKQLPICYNCQHWIGGGDWGLSCTKNYYVCSSYGFNKACEEFEKKTTT